MLSQLTITPLIATKLIELARVDEVLKERQLTEEILVGLRHGAIIRGAQADHYLSGEWLSKMQVEELMGERSTVQGYCTALRYLEERVMSGDQLDEKVFKMTHALVINEGLTGVIPSPYRTRQRIVHDHTGNVTYMPPSYDELPGLMRNVFEWLESTEDYPAPLQAATLLYKLMSIQPYLKGNDTTARLFASALMQQGGYTFGGLFHLEEAFDDPKLYMKALGFGGIYADHKQRLRWDMTPWIEFFLTQLVKQVSPLPDKIKPGTVEVNKVTPPPATERPTPAPSVDASPPAFPPPKSKLDWKQQKARDTFQSAIITANEIADLFNLQPRTGRLLCAQWTENGFMQVVDSSKKGRRYRLALQHANKVESDLKNDRAADLA